MSGNSKFLYLAIIVMIFVVAVPMGIAQITVTSLYPSMNSVQVSPSDSIEVVFNQPLDPQSIESALYLRGEFTGGIPFTYSFTYPSTIQIFPTFGLAEGEKHFVTIGSNLRSQNGTVFDSGFQATFKVKPNSVSTNFLPPVYLVLPFNSDPGDLLAVDLNNNLLPDLVVINRNNSTISFFENRMLRTGQFIAASNIALNLNPVPVLSSVNSLIDLPIQVSVKAADLNGDGYNDVIVTAPLANRIALLFNDGSKQFNFDIRYLNVFDRPVSTEIIDFDNDGDLDLIVTLFGSDQILLFENDGTGNFTERFRFETGLAPVFTSVDDFNNDGHLDLMVLSQSVEIFYGTQGRLFSREVVIDDLEFLPSSLSSDNLLGNTNQSNFIDFAITSRNDNTARIYRNESGNFSLGLTRNYVAFGRPTSITTGVLSNKNRSDLILGFNSSNHILIQRNSDSGDFNSGGITVIENVSNPVSMFTADLSFNGAMDIAVSNEGSNFVTIYFAQSERDGCISISDLEFGDVCVGETVELFLILENLCPFVLHGTISTDSEIFTIEETDFALDPNGTLRIPVQFGPLDNVEYTLEGVIDFYRDQEKSIFAGSVPFKLRGFGVEADVTVQETLNFGTGIIGSTIQQTVEIRNSGQIPVTITSVNSSNPRFSVPESVIGRLILPGQVYLMPVSFSPTSEDDFNGVIRIVYDSECESEITREVRVTGSGLPPLPDFVALSITNSVLPEYVVRQPYEFTGNFTLRNQSVSGTVRVGFLVNDELSVSNVINGANIGQAYSFTSFVSFESIGVFTLSFFVDINDAVRESDESNNEVQIQIRVVEGELIVKPNPFTPNDDGFNDLAVFDFSGLEVFQDNKVRIYTMEGREVRTLNGSGQPIITWDGIGSNNAEQPPGVYLYQALVGNRVIKQGSVVLAR
jgi:hypothetical protein